MASPMLELAPPREENCASHGAYQSRNFVGSRWSSCPKCAEEERHNAQEELKASERRQRITTMLRESGLAGRFEAADFDGFVAELAAQQKVLQACREFAQTVSVGAGSLWLIGPPGTGKTHLGSAIVRHVIEQRGRHAAIFSGREIVRMLRATWGKRTQESDWSAHSDHGTPGWPTTEDALIDALGRIGLLVIDEIGASFGTEAEQVQLFDIIDLRYKHRLPTVLLSNLPAKALKDAIGDRAYDRLREGAQVLPCNWDSYRGKPAAGKVGLQVVPK
jgi:DNA replication protein DnaC